MLWLAFDIWLIGAMLTLVAGCLWTGFSYWSDCASTDYRFQEELPEHSRSRTWSKKGVLKRLAFWTVVALVWPLGLPIAYGMFNAHWIGRAFNLESKSRE